MTFAAVKSIKILYMTGNFIMLQKEDLREVVAEMVQEVISKGIFKEQPIDNDNVYCDRDEACAHLHITPTTLWRMEKAGKIKAYKVGRRNLYSKQDIDELIKKG
jgi:excisionase family DNA binding protein